MKKIDKNNYCPHGKAINIGSHYDDFIYCACCERYISYEELLELESNTKLCKTCLTAPIITELL